VLPQIVGSIAVGGLICVLYGALIERSWYRLRRYRLPILPADVPESLTILHLSDLHFVRNDRRKARFLASLPPADVTVVTGDFLAEPEAIDTVVEAVRPVRGRLASWFVLGSNDYFAPRPLNYLAYFRKTRRRRWARPGRVRELIGKLTAEGWNDLTNDRCTVELAGLPIELLGLDDAHLRWQDFRMARRRAPERFGIAVMHSPDSAPEAAALGYELMVAGHTHGGQVRLPLVGAIVTNCTMPRRLVSGLIRMGSSTLHTSPGLGTSKYAPFRFWCRPEATILELTRAPAEASAASPTEATSLH
jgi:uncharacterized protein